MPRSNEEFEYRLPGDEPLKHQWDDNVQKDWHRHLPAAEQKKYGTDPAKAWDQHQKDMDLNWMAESYPKEPKPPRGDGLPGISLRAYYSKKRTKALKDWAAKKK
jgi:hypothetical protein